MINIIDKISMIFQDNFFFFWPSVQCTDFRGDIGREFRRVINGALTEKPTLFS